MKRPSLALWVFLGLLVVGAAHMLYYYPVLPERIASHFDVSGKPDGWSTKPAFFRVYAGTLLGTGFFLLILSLGISKVPTWAINLPNKAYWLAEERRDGTYSFLSNRLLWFANVTIALLIACMHLVIRANLGPAPDLGESPWLLLGAYAVFTVVWCIGLALRFKKVRNR